MSGKIVSETTATIYLAAGKRFFSKHAAYLGAARIHIRNRCSCYMRDASEGYAWETCKFHRQYTSDYRDRAAVLVRRYARFLKRADAKAELAK